jgi:3-oxoacyl-[acyl-carrier-protein] synthase II
MTEASATNARTGVHPRDAIVTGMGFCLPGIGEPVFTVDNLWTIASYGRTCLSGDGVHYGAVNLPAEAFAERLPDMPGVFAQHFTDAHRFGLVSLAEACTDAKLDPRSGDLTAAAILVGRGSIDANFDSYQAMIQADPETITAQGAIDLFIAGEQAVTPSDVALVQAAFTRTTAPSFTVSSGCTSSAVQLGIARLLIATGEVDIAVVTGVDVFNVDILRKAQQLLEKAQRSAADPDPDDLPESPKDVVTRQSLDGLMRPYDKRGGSVSYGEGAVTLVLESRDHASRRGAHQYGQILAQATTRDGLANPLAGDVNGSALAAAARKCLQDRWTIEQVPYVHGASDGGTVVTGVEVDAITQLYGPAASDVLMTSHEACFGHNGAPSGNLGVALTLLMMERDQVCPTANCEEPAEGIIFDPVPGVHARPLQFDYALSFNYQVGGVRSAVLLGSPNAA